MYFKPQLFEYDNGKHEVQIGIIEMDIYCGMSQVVFQPVKKIGFGFYFAYGQNFRTFDACLKAL